MSDFVSDFTPPVRLRLSPSSWAQHTSPSPQGALLGLSGLALATSLMLSTSAMAQSVNPLDAMPGRVAAFETGNINPAGTFELNVGARQTSPDNRAGTGNQVYHGGGSYAFTDRFTLGLQLQNYVDPIGGPIEGVPGVGPDRIPQLETNELALWGKYQLYQDERWAISALASAEAFLTMQSDIWGGFFNKQTGITLGAVKAPITYKASSKLQLHLTPSLTLAPNDIAGDRFYGTIFSLGAGLTFKPNNRVALFGTLDAPISNDNTINSQGEWEKLPVWTVGGRYNVTPRVALEGYVTNGWGVTPATSIMTFWPDGDHILVGGRLVYTPGSKYDESYRDLSLPPTQAQLNAQQDGFTLGTAATLEPGHMRTEIWGGSDSNAGISLNFSTDRDTEIQVHFEQFSDSDTAPDDIRPSTDVHYMIGPKLRFMDQDNGNAFSLAGRMMYGRQITSNSVKIGVFYTDLIANYEMPNRLSFTASPKIAAWGSVELVGLGLGLDYTFDNGLALIAEVTPIGRDNDEATWAAGARYHFGKSGFSVDAMATNAIGRQGIGSMIAQDDTRFAVTLSKSFDPGSLF
ncbi:hypothetical protein J7382_12385 [Shimia sp. R11_0]|uniref:DUF1302 family protein n=1 Tax=Shimia sp. R11_0 TaxID=2821096 RepID=UPI001ADD2D36|nr:DUF1302 family protein [Shimia sp. R11_0]MBO9478335.1 hypothetical protein [Shimia sp. R11_0]